MRPAQWFRPQVEKWPPGGPPHPPSSFQRPAGATGLRITCSLPRQRLLGASILPMMGILSQSKVSPHLPLSGTGLTRHGLWQAPRCEIVTLGDHGGIHISDCEALWYPGFLCSLPCPAWATWDWMLVGRTASRSLP